jgi:hypothetical protein
MQERGLPEVPVMTPAGYTWAPRQLGPRSYGPGQHAMAMDGGRLGRGGWRHDRDRPRMEIGMRCCCRKGRVELGTGKAGDLQGQVDGWMDGWMGLHRGFPGGVGAVLGRGGCKREVDEWDLVHRMHASCVRWPSMRNARGRAS